MSDYAACSNESCTRKDTCCRYLMVVDDNERQTMVMITGDGADCELYWPLSEGAPFKLRKV